MHKIRENTVYGKTNKVSDTTNWRTTVYLKYIFSKRKILKLKAPIPIYKKVGNFICESLRLLDIKWALLMVIIFLVLSFRACKNINEILRISTNPPSEFKKLVLLYK